MPFALDEEKIDPQGRYILLRGKLDGTPIVLGSLYFPNSDQHLFLEELSLLLADWAHTPWILGGDFNTILDTTLDRSHPPLPGSPVIRCAKVLCQWLSNWALTDAWRAKNDGAKEYSFSHPHQQHTRIDSICSPMYCSLLYFMQHIQARHCQIITPWSWAASGEELLLLSRLGECQYLY